MAEIKYEIWSDHLAPFSCLSFKLIGSCHWLINFVGFMVSQPLVTVLRPPMAVFDTFPLRSNKFQDLSISTMFSHHLSMPEVRLKLCHYSTTFWLISYLLALWINTFIHVDKILHEIKNVWMNVLKVNPDVKINLKSVNGHSAILIYQTFSFKF